MDRHRQAHVDVRVAQGQEGGAGAGPPVELHDLALDPQRSTSSRRTRRSSSTSRRTGHGCSAVVSAAFSGSGPRPWGAGVLMRRTLGGATPGRPRDGPVARIRGRSGRHLRWRAWLTPRSACSSPPRAATAPGVDRAVVTVEKALELYGAPVYVRKEIVHNKHVVTTLQKRGAIFVDETDEVPEGATVVFSAHGVAPGRPRGGAGPGRCAPSTRPARWSPRCTTRPCASPTSDYDILLIGHEGHEEVVGTAGEAPEHIQLVDGPDDVDQRRRSATRRRSSGSPRPRCRSTRRWRPCGGCASASPRCRTRPATTSATPPRTASSP